MVLGLVNRNTELGLSHRRTRSTIKENRSIALSGKWANRFRRDPVTASWTLINRLCGTTSSLRIISCDFVSIIPSKAATSLRCWHGRRQGKSTWVFASCGFWKNVLFYQRRSRFSPGQGFCSPLKVFFPVDEGVAGIDGGHHVFLLDKGFAFVGKSFLPPGKKAAGVDNGHHVVFQCITLSLTPRLHSPP